MAAKKKSTKAGKKIITALQSARKADLKTIPRRRPTKSEWLQHPVIAAGFRIGPAPKAPPAKKTAVSYYIMKNVEGREFPGEYVAEFYSPGAAIDEFERAYRCDACYSIVKVTYSEI
jgi:hypothetical protein